MTYQDRQAENRARARRTNRNTLIIVGAIIGLLCLCGGVGSIFGDDNDAEQPTPTTTRATPTTTRPTTAPAPGSAPTRLESTAPTTDSAPTATRTPEPAPAPPVASAPEPERAPEPTTVPPPPAPLAPQPEPTVAPPPPAPSNVYYKNCAAARAAGAAPLYAGEPGYRSGLDKDGDGVACE